jgi:glyoxylase-like metal-dependent hydrolase (beta-lactamase superfamily II)
MTIDLGRLRVDVLSDGEFRLDGGAMFGMVPRERWETWCPPDERNRIRLGTHSICVRGPDFVLVVEQGIGEGVDEDLFAIDRSTSLEESLAAIGVAPGDVTHATCTHWHFDHAGGGGRFPNATYFVQRREWEAMTHPSVLHNRSYRIEDRPPEERIEFVDGDAEILPGVAVRLTGGHTPGHQVIVLEDRALFWGDLFPTAHHLSPPRTMAYDLFPADVAEQKIALLAESAEKGWWAFLYHDLDPAPGKVERDGKRYRLVRR